MMGTERGQELLLPSQLAKKVLTPFWLTAAGTREMTDAIVRRLRKDEG